MWKANNRKPILTSVVRREINDHHCTEKVSIARRRALGTITTFIYMHYIYLSHALEWLPVQKTGCIGTDFSALLSTLLAELFLVSVYI